MTVTIGGTSSSSAFIGEVIVVVVVVVVLEVRESEDGESKLELVHLRDDGAADRRRTSLPFPIGTTNALHVFSIVIFTNTAIST